jgi:NitT/TauT family transport system ATP-binding protein
MAAVTTARPLAAPGPAVQIDIRRKEFAAVGQRGAIEVLRNIHLAIQPRSFVVVTGPSGCGKSTLLNIVAGLDQDYEGSVAFAAGEARLGFVFQSPRLLPWRTVEENIALVLPKGDPRAALIPELIQRVGLEEAAHAYPERISLGMQRRAALARAFVVEPDILLMDEPFVSLDDPTAQGLRQLLIELWTRRPTTVLFVTHDRFEAVMLATRILRMAGGSATIVEDVAVTLSPSERASRDSVAKEQQRIFGAT